MRTDVPFQAPRDKLAKEKKMPEKNEKNYGYGFYTEEQLEDSTTTSKDPRQIFYGLEPGWVINLADRCIYKPLDPELEDIYQNS